MRRVWVPSFVPRMFVRSPHHASARRIPMRASVRCRARSGVRSDFRALPSRVCTVHDSLLVCGASAVRARMLRVRAVRTLDSDFGARCWARRRRVSSLERLATRQVRARGCVLGVVGVVFACGHPGRTVGACD